MGIVKKLPMPLSIRLFFSIAKCWLYLKLSLDWRLVNKISVETITACNLRCPYCPNSLYDRGLIKNTQKMRQELFRKIIDELAELGWCGELLPHSYGEPLLDDRLIEFIRYARSKISGLIINLTTNGELLDVAMYKELIDAGVNVFTVTQHLPEPSEGVMKVLEYREKYGAGNITFSYDKIHDIANRAGLVPVKNTSREVVCSRTRWPFYTFGIDYAGNVLICCHDYLHEVDVGNVNENKLIEIWNSPGYRKIRGDIAIGKFSLSICKRCAMGEIVSST